MGILKRPMKLIRNMETSNYGSSNYGSSTVLVISWLNCKHTLKLINFGGNNSAEKMSAAEFPKFSNFGRKQFCEDFHRNVFPPKFLGFNVHESGSHTLIFEQA